MDSNLMASRDSIQVLGGTIRHHPNDALDSFLVSEADAPSAHQSTFGEIAASLQIAGVVMLLLSSAKGRPAFKMLAQSRSLRIKKTLAKTPEPWRPTVLSDGA